MCRNTKELHGYHDLLRQNLLSLDPPKQNPACLDDHQGLGVKTPELQKWEMCSSFSYCKDTDISWKLWAGACYFRRKYLLAGRNPVFILPNAFRCKKKKKKMSFDLSGKAVVLPLCMGSLGKLSKDSSLEPERCLFLPAFAQLWLRCHFI